MTTGIHHPGKRWHVLLGGVAVADIVAGDDGGLVGTDRATGSQTRLGDYSIQSYASFWGPKARAVAKPARPGEPKR